MQSVFKITKTQLTSNDKNLITSQQKKYRSIQHPKIFVEPIHLSRIVVIEIFSFFSSKTDFRFEFLVKTYVYSGNFSLMQ